VFTSAPINKSAADLAATIARVAVGGGHEHRHTRMFFRIELTRAVAQIKPRRRKRVALAAEKPGLPEGVGGSHRRIERLKYPDLFHSRRQGCRDGCGGAKNIEGNNCAIRESFLRKILRENECIDDHLNPERKRTRGSRRI